MNLPMGIAIGTAINNLPLGIAIGAGMSDPYDTFEGYREPPSWMAVMSWVFIIVVIMGLLLIILT